MRTFGLIGKNIKYSFSKEYFREKFIREKIYDSEYLNFELQNINEFKQLVKEKKVSGLNVTAPYKECVIPLLDDLTDEAKIIGAVNTIQVIKKKLVGHNTDVVGFQKSIKPLILGRKNALILGDGGAAKAVKYVLKKLNISYKIVNRKSSFTYSDITSQSIGFNNIIINTTPLGMFPDTKSFPKIPYNSLTEKHLLFDLIYNPQETQFIKYGKSKEASVKNGMEMLQIQAEMSWKIWNL